jgi:hypothetical protein
MMFTESDDGNEALIVLLSTSSRHNFGVSFYHDLSYLLKNVNEISDIVSSLLTKHTMLSRIH